MPRIARVVIPGMAHFVTQRGNRRQTTFFGGNDYRFYRLVLTEWCRRCRVEIWGYCLLPDHVHLIAVPDSECGLRAAIGETHKRYSRLVNEREGWQGHLWQGRFFSCPLDEKYLLTAARHIETNPVRIGLASSPERYPWSSAGPHLSGKDDGLVKVKPLLDRIDNWRDFLSDCPSTQDIDLLRRHEKTGRPLGNPPFIARIETKLNRIVRRQKPGPKPAGSRPSVLSQGVM